MRILYLGSFILLMLLSCSSCVTAVSSDTDLKTLIIRKSDREEISYHVEVADTDTARRRGLMYRDNLPSDQGMLLDFLGNTNVGIWMKNTYISLDLVFINGMGKIIYIYQRATPLSTRTISTDQKVRAVLEINAGQVAAKGIRIGDRVMFPSFNTSE